MNDLLGPGDMPTKLLPGDTYYLPWSSESRGNGTFLVMRGGEFLRFRPSANSSVPILDEISATALGNLIAVVCGLEVELRREPNLLTFNVISCKTVQ